jgi:hypothetical protein
MKIEKTKFDDMMIEIGETFFNLQQMLQVFVVEIFEAMKIDSIKIDLELSYFNGEKIELLKIDSIFFDNEDELLKIKIIDREKSIILSDIDISMFDRIANEIHFLYNSENIYNKLSGNKGN